MRVDVISEIEIARPREEVAEFAADPDNATRWYENIKAVEWRSQRPLAVGSVIEFRAAFLGRRLTYSYELTDYLPGRRLVMATAEGPFPMETTYLWEDTSPESTLMTLRNRGEPSGFTTLAAPLLERAMRRANRKDLARLKQVIEERR